MGRDYRSAPDFPTSRPGALWASAAPGLDRTIWTAVLFAGGDRFAFGLALRIAKTIADGSGIGRNRSAGVPEIDHDLAVLTMRAAILERLVLGRGCVFEIMGPADRAALPAVGDRAEGLPIAFVDVAVVQPAGAFAGGVHL